MKETLPDRVTKPESRAYFMLLAIKRLRKHNANLKKKLIQAQEKRKATSEELSSLKRSFQERFPPGFWQVYLSRWHDPAWRQTFFKKMGGLGVWAKRDNRYVLEESVANLCEVVFKMWETSRKTGKVAHRDWDYNSKSFGRIKKKKLKKIL